MTTKQPLSKEESERAIKIAVPLYSLGFVETHIRNPKNAVLIVRIQPVSGQQTGDLWAFSGHPKDLVESLRRTADDLEKHYHV